MLWQRVILFEFQSENVNYGIMTKVNGFCKRKGHMLSRILTIFYSLPIAMQNLRRLSLHKGLAQPPHPRYNATDWRGKSSVRSTPANYKNRFLSPVTRVFRKRFLTTCLTTDSRGVCGNSGVKSCEEHP